MLAPSVYTLDTSTCPKVPAENACPLASLLRKAAACDEGVFTLVTTTTLPGMMSMMVTLEVPTFAAVATAEMHSP